MYFLKQNCTNLYLSCFDFRLIIFRLNYLISSCRRFTLDILTNPIAIPNIFSWSIYNLLFHWGLLNNVLGVRRKLLCTSLWYLFLELGDVKDEVNVAILRDRFILKLKVVGERALILLEVRTSCGILILWFWTPLMHIFLEVDYDLTFGHVGYIIY